MDIRNIVRVGIISTVNIETCSARVTFLDKQDTVSADLPVLNRGSMIVKDYWLPDIGEQVLCLFLGNNFNTILVTIPKVPSLPTINCVKL